MHLALLFQTCLHPHARQPHSRLGAPNAHLLLLWRMRQLHGLVHGVPQLADHMRKLWRSREQRPHRGAARGCNHVASWRKCLARSTYAVQLKCGRGVRAGGGHYNIHVRALLFRTPDRGRIRKVQCLR